MTRQQSRSVKPAARVRKRTPRPKPAECVFRKGFVTDRIDPIVDDLWKHALKVKTPFGDLRNMWRRHHCRTLNPYGDSDTNCPFDQEECAKAFLSAVLITTEARPTVPMGYFIKVARSRAAVRADLAVEKRARAASLRRTSVLSAHEAISDHPQAAAQPDAQPGSVATPPRPGGEAGREDRLGVRPQAAGHKEAGDARDNRATAPVVPSRSDGPVSLGELLGRVAPRPRQDGAQDGSEGGRR